MSTSRLSMHRRHGSVVLSCAAWILVLFVAPSMASADWVIPLSDEISLVMEYIPSGQFSMGSPVDEVYRRDNEDPQHQVTLTDGYWMGKFEVTQAQWQTVMGSNPSYFQGGGYGDAANRPVEQVSWYDVQDFLTEINELTSLSFRLPTEAEWEYAARAGTTTPYFWGDETNTGDYAWYEGNSGDQTHDVGGKLPNAWGLYDTSGNVWEWVQDWYGEYPTDDVIDPLGPDAGLQRVQRGGAYIYTPHDIGNYRSAYRGASDPETISSEFGFRLVHDAVVPEPATIVLLGTGIVLIFAGRRRREE